jgi:hypothetical protein
VAFKTEMLIEQVASSSTMACDVGRREMPVGLSRKMYCGRIGASGATALAISDQPCKGDVMLVKAKELKGYSVPIRFSPKTTRCRVLPFPGVKFIVSWSDGAAGNPEQ